MLAMMQARCSPFKGQLEEHPTCEKMSINFAMCLCDENIKKKQLQKKR